MKRVVTVQDISCIGKCSLTVALPIISAAGVETAIIPTAILSTHTAFSSFTFTDLTDSIQPISDHWKEQNFDFDAIYTGYLGSFDQLRLMEDFFDRFKGSGTQIIVDPVMGDNGKLYSGFDRQFAAKMAHLCKKADIVLPNYTEACFMLGLPCDKQVCNEQTAKDLLIRLTDACSQKAVLTGVTRADGKYGAMGYDSKSGQFFGAFCEHIQKSFHGTGDVFASAFTGALMNDKDLGQALEIAAKYTVESMKATMTDPNGRWYGVDFETALPFYINEVRS